MNLMNVFRAIGALGVCALAVSLVTSMLSEPSDVLPEVLFVVAVIALAVGALGMFVVGMQ